MLLGTNILTTRTNNYYDEQKVKHDAQIIMYYEQNVKHYGHLIL